MELALLRGGEGGKTTKMPNMALRKYVNKFLQFISSSTQCLRLPLIPPLLKHSLPAFLQVHQQF
jgi:hypothetical protein